MMVRGLCLALAMAPSAATAQTFICDGHITNGYAVTSPGFRTFEARTVEVSLECDWLVRYVRRQGECDYRFDGRRFRDGFLFRNGDFSFNHTHLSIGRLTVGNQLSFKVSDEPVGVSGNEGQRWFRAFCEEAK